MDCPKADSETRTLRQVDFGEVILEGEKMIQRREKSQGTLVGGILLWASGVQAYQDLLKKL